MQTRDLDEAVDAVSRVYCPHRVHVEGRRAAVNVDLAVAKPTAQPLVQLSYSTPVRIDAGDFPRLFLMMHCAQGGARARQGHLISEWSKGQTMPFSAGIETQLWFDGAFVQRGMRLDVDEIEKLCSRWLGHPLHARLRFALRPFSAELERIWQCSLSYVASLEEKGSTLAPASRAALDEYLLTLLLQQHPHNFSDELVAHVPTPVPGMIRRAERYMAEHASAPITVADVADAVGLSVRSLQQGFRQWRSTTPMLFLREQRLRRVREELLRRSGTESVTQVALRFGFVHLGRFSRYYRAAFGEAPNVTARRARR